MTKTAAPHALTLAQTLSFPLTMSMFLEEDHLHERAMDERRAAAKALAEVETVTNELTALLPGMGCTPEGFAHTQDLEPLLKRLQAALMTQVERPAAKAA